MNRPLLALLLLCAVALATDAQEKTARPAERAVILDLRMAEINSTRAEDLDRIAKEKNRLDAMIADGSALPVATMQMRLRPDEQNSVRIGQLVPVQTAALPAFAAPAAGQPDRPPVLGYGVPQISYEFGGLNVRALSRLRASDQIEIQLEIEMTGVEHSTGNFTPTFTQRAIKETVLLRQNEPVLLMGLIQDLMLAPAFSHPSNTQPISQPRGNFVIVVSARLID